MLNFTSTANVTLSLVLWLLLSTSLISAFTHAETSRATVEQVQTKSVATVAPIAHSLLTELLATTEITIHYLPPKRLPINRLTNWVATHASKKQPNVSAVVGIDAMRPALSFYTALRKENIQLVNIDIAKALMPGGEQVAIYQHNQQGYFWLNLNNALLMTGILRRDLTALWPEHAEKINTNAAKVSQQLRQISMQLDDDLFDKNIEQLAVAKPELADFAASFPFPIVSLELAKTNGLKTLFISKIKRNSKNTKTALGKNINRWAIDDFSKVSSRSFTQRWLKTAESLN
jgi:hypothetical protein